MTRLCKFVVARELIATMSQRFTSQTAPDTVEELRIRRMQETHVASIIGSMVHADGMARKWSSVADQIFTEAKKLVEVELPRAEAEFSQRISDSMAFGVKISEICHDEMMRRYKP
jgi:hypothetical protein